MYMSNPMRGAVAGFVASLVLAGVFYFKGAYDLMPEVNIIRLLANFGSLGEGSAWADHFIVGSLIWGLTFGAGASLSTHPPAWVKGIIFGMFAWLLTMVTFLPVAGSGFFGLKIGPMVAVWMLVLHVIFGFVLGVTYGLLTYCFPERPPEAAGG